jgi:hypothetical protein
MRQPFYMDKLDPQEQTDIKRWHLRNIAFYSLLALVIVMLAAVKIDRVHSQLAKFSPTSDAVAAARPGSPVCAARDLKLVTLLEEAGEAKALPGEQLAEVFFTMMKARELCSAGRVAEAIAVYDAIVIAPKQATN